MLHEFPEFNEFKDVKDFKFVLGGFGALGNPSSFHHPLIRYIRKLFKYNIAMQLMKEFVHLTKSPLTNVEMLYDRFCIRHENQGNVSPESWHRDFNKTKYDCDADITFGGWINLNEVCFYQKKNIIYNIHR